MNVLLKETINYTIRKTCNEELLKPICKKLISKWLMYKLTTDCMIQFNQVDDYTMDGPLSVVLADIHMVRTDNEVVKRMNSWLYKPFAKGTNFSNILYLKF